MKNKINKILFLVNFPFNKRDYDRFGVELLKENGFVVEIWNFMPFLKPHAYQRLIVPGPSNYEKYLVFKSEKEALDAIYELSKETFIVSLIYYNTDTYNIYKAISKKKLPYCGFGVNVLPSSFAESNDPQNIFVKVCNKLNKINFEKINSKVKELFFRYLTYAKIAPATIILAGGEKSVLYDICKTKPNTEILWAHTLDYDLYLKEKQNPVQPEANTAVFLDGYTPFHPDIIFMREEPFCRPAEYYPHLCKFFDVIEKNWGIRVIIAAHPHSDYERRPDYFGGRPVIKGKIAELVKRSSFVILQCSTAINFAVLYKKPVIFTTTNSLNRSCVGKPIERMASLFGKNVINLDRPLQLDFAKEMAVDEQAYKAYKNAYIKKEGTEDLPFWQIFANYIKLLN